jgi:hypothetical protein
MGKVKVKYVKYTMFRFHDEKGLKYTQPFVSHFGHIVFDLEGTTYDIYLSFQHSSN